MPTKQGHSLVSNSHEALTLRVSGLRAASLAVLLPRVLFQERPEKNRGFCYYGGGEGLRAQVWLSEPHPQRSHVLFTPI